MRSTINPGDGDRRHGTVNGYINLSCRCDGCRAAWTEQHRAYMHSHPEQSARHRKREHDRRRRRLQHPA